MVPERGRALNGACGDTAVRDVTYEAPYQEPQRQKVQNSRSNDSREDHVVWFVSL
jgi:hypothetical protein